MVAPKNNDIGEVMIQRRAKDYSKAGKFPQTPIRSPQEMREESQLDNIRQGKVEKRGLDTPTEISNRIFEAIGHRDAIESFLHTEDDRYVELARSMLDPKCSGMSFRTLYRRVGLTSMDILESFRRFKLDESLIALHKALPKVSQDVMDDAESYFDLCPRCSGERELILLDKTKLKCPRCSGKGIVKQKGDAKAREMAFKATGLVQDKVISINQNFGMGIRPMDDIMKDTVIDLPVLEGKEDEPDNGKVGGSGEAVETDSGLLGVDIEGPGVDNGPGEGKGE